MASFKLAQLHSERERTITNLPVNSIKIMQTSIPSVLQIDKYTSISPNSTTDYSYCLSLIV